MKDRKTRRAEAIERLLRPVTSVRYSGKRVRATETIEEVQGRRRAEAARLKELPA